MRNRATAFCLLMLAAMSAHAAPGTDCVRPLRASNARNVVIDAAVTRAKLPIPGLRDANVELVLRDIRFDRHPGTQFHVILERRDDRTKRARAGTLSFYAATKGPITRTFDVTDELRELSIRGEVDVVFEATSGRANAKATFDPDTKLTIGEIALRAK